MFYKFENEQLVSGERVTAPTFELLSELKDTYSYPVNGWYWFDSEIDAQVLLTIPQISKISMRQARRELLNRNLLDTVDAIILSMPREVQIDWEYASEVERNNPLVMQLATALNMSDSDMNDFFSAASLL